MLGPMGPLAAEKWARPLADKLLVQGVCIRLDLAGALVCAL